MIIGRGSCEGEDLLLIGLSAENQRRLTAGEPIKLTRASHGDGIPKGWAIVIFAGSTEYEMQTTLEMTGAIDKTTQIHKDPRL